MTDLPSVDEDLALRMKEENRTLSDGFRAFPRGPQLPASDVYNGRARIGSIRGRPPQVTALDRDGRSLGTFPTTSAAIAAVRSQS
jgi:hypothetical protein